MKTARRIEWLASFMARLKPKFEKGANVLWGAGITEAAGSYPHVEAWSQEVEEWGGLLSVYFLLELSSEFRSFPPSPQTSFLPCSPPSFFSPLSPLPCGDACSKPCSRPSFLPSVNRFTMARARVVDPPPLRRRFDCPF